MSVALKKRFLVWVIWLLPFLAGAETTNLPSYFTRIWQTDDGLPNNAVTAIVQTHNGYLWLATYDGLVRFDGASFTRFDNSNTPEMRSSRVTSLFEDAESNLWIGYETGELNRYQNGHFYPVNFQVPWENKKILIINDDVSGKIWLLNANARLANLDGEALSPSGVNDPGIAVGMARSRQGEIWISCDGKIFILNGGRLLPSPLTGQPENYAKGVCASRDGGFWVLTQDRIFKCDGDKNEDLGPSPLGQSSITAMMQMKSGCLAVGTLEQGLFLIFPGLGVVHLNRASGFPENWVRTLYEDREGTLWVGTGSSGLIALRPSRVTTVNAPDGWQGASLLSVTRANNGALWIGTEGAGLYQLYQNNWSHFVESDGISNLFVWSVCEDSQNQLWVGTWGGGLLVQHEDHFKRVAGLKGFDNISLAILHGRNGVTWIGTGTGLLRYQNGAFTHYGEKEGLALPDVRALVEAPDGTLWFGMMGGGLGRLQNDVLKQFRKAAGVPDFVQCLHLDADGKLWIGTYGDGLACSDHGHFSVINANQGLPNNIICDIEQDDFGNFWFSSHGGIFRIRKTELNECLAGKISEVHPLVYGIGDGMPTLECSGGFQPASCKTEDGKLWFSTSKGLAVVDPSNIKVNQLPPPVLIENMLVDGNPMEITGNTNVPLRIPPGRQRFEFRYTGLSFVAPEKVSFKYRLEGLEKDYADAGTKRTIIYSYIPPGNYRFHVTACNSDGVWNPEGATLAFTVLPYFWQTLWFHIVGSLAAVALIGYSALWITRRRMRRKLERLERQRAIERERTRIARDIHDNLGANLTRISLLSQSAHGELHNPEQAAAQLNRIYNTTRELTRAMDEIVWAVNPEHDTLDSLVNYLGKFGQEFLGSLDVRCRLDLPMQLPQWLITAEVRHNLFLAVKEALNNVVKHATASEVTISLTTAANSFTLSVRDNGRGFTPETLTQKSPPESGRLVSGNGLNNMRRRLEKIGGRCEIISAPGKGTDVKFIVPVAMEDSPVKRN
ncbi:MAG TPA: two-component regulator propeller domain-containing protein [Verrucomicrobiae bacterium]|nr:two-component regulator propeller domain-containing protein [Verrucomicrobiae bacterium]